MDRALNNNGPHERTTGADDTEGDLEDQVYVRGNFAVCGVEKFKIERDVDDLEGGNNSDTVNRT